MSDSQCCFNFCQKEGAFHSNGVLLFLLLSFQVNNWSFFYNFARIYRVIQYLYSCFCFCHSFIHFFLPILPYFHLLVRTIWFCNHINKSDSLFKCFFVNTDLWTSWVLWFGTPFRVPWFGILNLTPWFGTHPYFHLLTIQFSLLQLLEYFVFETKHLLIKLVMSFAVCNFLFISQ